jgi:hypothetical protein
MKTYKSTAGLLAEIEGIFEGNRPSAHRSPLDTVLESLHLGRHYSWAGFYIAVDGKTASQAETTNSGPGQISLAKSRSKILVSMKLAGREYGILGVESERKTFRPEDRVFLERVGYLGARFLAGPGKYLVRRAQHRALLGKAQAAVA